MSFDVEELKPILAYLEKLVRARELVRVRGKSFLYNNSSVLLLRRSNLD